MTGDNDNGFRYTYSAAEQDEVKKIREKYTMSEQEDKMTRLRRLDASVYSKAQTVGLTVGIAGTLILGFGMSLIMSELGSMLGITNDIAFPLGIAVGALGAVIVTVAYPLYNLVIKRERKRIAPEILRLSDELMK